MKISIDVNSLSDEFAGSGSYLINLLINLSQIDKKNKYFIYASENPSLDLSSNFKFYRIKESGSISWDLKAVAHAKYKHNSDLFFANESLISAILHNRSVLAINNIGMIRFPELYPQKSVKTFRRLLPIALKRAKHIITPSESIKGSLEQRYGVSREKMTKIEGSAPRWAKKEITGDEIQRVVEKYTLPAEYLLFVGTVDVRKNISLFLQALADLKKNRKKQIHTVLVGMKGYKHEKIFKEIIDLELSQDVIFTGHVPESDMKPIYSLAKALVLPSKTEGFGLTPLEGLACEVPVICSSKGAIGEVVGDACIDIDTSSKESLVEAIEKILDDKKLAKRLIRKGKKQVKEFSWKKSAGKLLKVFRDVVAEESDSKLVI